MSDKDLLPESSSQQYQNPRAKYRLSFNDYNLVVSLVQDIRENKIAIKNEDDLDNIQLLCDKVYSYFPNCKIHKLSFKDNYDKKNYKDNLAFAIKIDDTKSEIYALAFGNGILSIIDQYRCDMYGDDAPFIEPDWTNIKYYKEIIKEIKE